jgi:hypothetical protein
MDGISSKQSSSRHLDKLGQLDLVLADIRREVRILQEHVANLGKISIIHKPEHCMYTYQPLSRSTDVSGSNSRNAITIRIVGVQGLERNIPRINGKRRPAKRHRYTRRGVAGNGKPTLTVGLRTLNGQVDSICVGLGHDDQCCASIEDGRATGQIEICTIDGGGVDCGLPETVLIDVVQGDQRLGIKLGVIKSAEGGSYNLIKVFDGVVWLTRM